MPQTTKSSKFQSPKLAK